ncbi:MAG: hypothetical protein HPY50_07020 [Firmicutes bacterium]|nr:hypothetical protein [Bacillota bacterium]
MAPRHQKVKRRIEELITGFQHYLHFFETNNPFNQYGQMDFHVETIRLLKKLGSTANALRSQEYTEALYRTLEAWGMNSRGAKLKPLPEFRAVLAVKVDEISDLESLSLQDCQEPSILAERLWQVISNLEVAENSSKLVAGTKILHHLLPNLVPPIDRAYTRVFFQWYGQMFQYQQSQFLDETIPYLVTIAQSVALDKYVTGRDWRTSPTKLIDNAIVGYCKENGLRLA